MIYSMVIMLVYDIFSFKKLGNRYIQFNINIKAYIVKR